MRKLFFVTLVVGFALVSKLALAEIIWQEDFDGYDANWSCSNGGCTGPTGFDSSARGDQSTSASPDIEITTSAEWSDPGGTNKRGYRVHIYSGTSGTCCENVLRKSMSFGTDFYLRFYTRYSTNRMGNYWKQFRFFASGSQVLIFEPKYRYSWGETRLNLTNASGSESSVTQWVFSDEYTANTWICVELFINQTNDEWTVWVDGENKGTYQWPFSRQNAITRIEVGGNQTTASGGDHTMDYDDIVISTTYVGPGEPGGGNQPPSPPQGLTILQ